MKNHESSYTRTAVVDLDGTLSEYDGWVSEDHFGEPIKNAREALHEIKTWGWRIVIFTTRGNTPKVEAWLLANQIPHDSVNSTEHNPSGTSAKPIAEVYFDDRDAHVVGEKPYNWIKAMRRVRKLYQPPLDVFIDDASLWANWPERLRSWFKNLRNRKKMTKGGLV